jgi:hypothetical protein
MKKILWFFPTIASMILIVLVLSALPMTLMAQDSVTPSTAKSKAVKNTFESVWIMDNQTVIVPVKKTFEIDIQHRFGVVNNGFDDVYGFFAPSNIRLGLFYTPLNNLMIGAGLTKEKKMLDLNVKYAIIQQTKDNCIPVSVSYFGNGGIELLDGENYRNSTDRLSFFNQLIIARKVTEKISAQIAPGLTHYNNVEAYFDSKGEVQNKMKNDHFSLSFAGRYKFNEKLAVTLGYDQPLTDHPTNNPYPNISLGLEVVTGSHAFQFFAGNYSSIVPQRNHMFNQNDYANGEFLIGFNITRLWNY